MLFLNTHDTRFGLYFKVFFVTKISQDVVCLFEIFSFCNDMSNNNVQTTLMICISLQTKIFHHGD